MSSACKDGLRRLLAPCLIHILCLHIECVYVLFDCKTEFFSCPPVFENSSYFLPPGFVGGRPSDGSQQVSPHALGRPV